MTNIDYQPWSKKDIEQEILRVRSFDLELEKTLCFILSEKAKLDNDDYALAFSYTFFADYYFATRKNTSCYYYLTRALKLSEAKQYESLLVYIYKYLGMYYTSIYDELTALDYYLKSLTLAEKQKDYVMLGATYTNIADCFETKRDMVHAVLYYKKSYEILKEHQVEQAYYAKAFILTNLCNSSFEAQHYEDVIQYAKEFQNIPKEAFTNDLVFLFTYCMYLYHLVKAQKEEALQQLHQLFNLQKSSNDRLMVYQVFVNVGEILLDLQDREHAEETIQILQSIDSEGDLKAQKQMQELMIRYYQIFDQKDALQHAYEHYFFLMNNIEHMENVKYSSGLQAKLELYSTKKKQCNLEKENELLESLMNQDELTKTRNRRSFHQCFTMEKAHHGKMLAIAMLDVDYFKEFNDIYGHPQGDVALIHIGEVLNEQENEHIYAFRYGGDEFAILFVDIQEDAVKAYLQTIYQNILEKKIPHIKNTRAPYLTVSYGYAFTTSLQDSPEKFLALADKNLYEAKKRRTSNNSRSDEQ